MHHHHHAHRYQLDAPRHGLPHDRPADRRFVRDPLEAERFGSRGHRHHGRRRIFDHGDLRFILLGMIATSPAHGYDLIKALEDRMGGGYSPSPGVIYPTLTMLQEQGLASVTTADGKKLYQATEAGTTFLARNKPAVDAIQARIDGIARQRPLDPDPRILRAIENLKTALRLRLSAGAVPDHQVQAIAAAIDAAATTAEQP